MNEDVVVTRDAGANLLYEDEAEAVRAAFRKKLGQRECRRAACADDEVNARRHCARSSQARTVSPMACLSGDQVRLRRGALVCGLGVTCLPAALPSPS